MIRPVAWLAFVVVLAQAATSADDVLRLEPAAFDRLPAPIVQYLEASGCTIPQPARATAQANFIQGRFTSAEPLDWAVLCSRQGTSSILVFRRGGVSEVDELAAIADADFLQSVGFGEAGFSRSITTANPDRIRAAAGASMLPALDRDGIEDGFLEKASSIWYWLDGQWMRLPGAD